MHAEPIAQKNPPPSVGDPQPPPLWAAPHRPRCGRRPTASVGGGLTKWTLLGNPPRGQKTAFLASTSLMSTLATDAERMDAANEHTADKHATDATAKDLPNAAEPTDSAPSSASKARKPKAAKSRQDNAGSASTAMVPIGNGEQTPMGASAITPATGLAGAAASPKNMGVSPMRGVNLSPASPHITGQKLLAVPKPVQEEDDEDDDVDEDGDADDDTHDFSFINSRGESTNYLDMSTSTLAGLLKNSKLAVKTAAKKIADSEPWTAIVEQQDEMQAGNLPNTWWRRRASRDWHS